MASLITIRSSISHSCMNEYLAVDSGEYVCTNSVCALIESFFEYFPKKSIIMESEIIVSPEVEV